MTRELNDLVAEKVMGHKFCPIHHGLFCCGRGAHYSTSIVDAWIVVVKMGGYFILITALENEGWIAHFGRDTDITKADTAPEAICLAALKAVGHDNS